jgi:hypothetical protein
VIGVAGNPPEGLKLIALAEHGRPVVEGDEVVKRPA